MTNEDMLIALKTDLGITTDVYNQRLLAYIQASKEEIKREGVTLNESVGDAELVIQYTAWMWRRRDSGQGMPRMVRYALNNRLFQEKIKKDD